MPLQINNKTHFMKEKVENGFRHENTDVHIVDETVPLLKIQGECISTYQTLFLDNLCPKQGQFHRFVDGRELPTSGVRTINTLYAAFGKDEGIFTTLRAGIFSGS